MDSVVDAALNGWLARMNDVSHFAKTFKGVCVAFAVLLV